MISQNGNENCVKLKVGDVFEPEGRDVVFRVTYVDEDTVSINCDKYWNLGDFTLSLFEMFRKLKKLYGISSCTYITKEFGVIKIDSNTSEQGVYRRLMKRSHF